MQSLLKKLPTLLPKARESSTDLKWKPILVEYIILRTIGSGSYGEVIKV